MTDDLDRAWFEASPDDLAQDILDGKRSLDDLLAHERTAEAAADAARSVWRGTRAELHDLRDRLVAEQEHIHGRILNVHAQLIEVNDRLIASLEESSRVAERFSEVAERVRARLARRLGELPS